MREDYARLARPVGMNPESHRTYDRDRHLNLLRRARSGELAAELAVSRRAQRRTRATALLRVGCRLAPGTAYTGYVEGIWGACAVARETCSPVLNLCDDGWARRDDRVVR